MDDDATRWDERHRTSELSTARPPDVLAAHPDVAAMVPRSGTALDIACGTGAQSLWLAECGLRVTALDVSPVAIGLTTASAERAGIRTIEAIVTDLDRGLPDDLHDLDVIVCQRFRHPDLYAQMIGRLRVGGVAVVTVLSEVGLDRPPGPFHASAGELGAAFEHDDVEMLVDVEAEGSASAVVIRRR